MVEVSPCPLVSIIMTTYNRANYIMDTIKTVRQQTYPNWELIIVDDGSDDDTEEKVLEIKDERIQFHKAGRIAINGKIKNIGIEKAKGEFIAFIDSDDLWHTEKLEKQIAAFHHYQDAGFSMTGGYNFRKPGEPVDFFYKQTCGIKCQSILIPFFKSQVSTTTPSLVIRKSCLAATGLFNETQPFSDVDYILKLALNFKAVILYEPLFYRRLHDSNDSNQNWITGYEQGIELIEAYKKKLPLKIAYDALFRLHINFGEDCLLRGKRLSAINKFLTSWKYKPFSIVPIKKTGKAILNYIA